MEEFCDALMNTTSQMDGMVSCDDSGSDVASGHARRKKKPRSGGDNMEAEFSELKDILRSFAPHNSDETKASGEDASGGSGEAAVGSSPVSELLDIANETSSLVKKARERKVYVVE